MGNVALILYGRGGTLGNFEVFAKSLAKKLRTSGKRVVMQNVERRTLFFDFLVNPPFKHVDLIGELHVFAHSIGAGLFLAYGDPEIAERRRAAVETATAKKLRLTFDEVVKIEDGAILTDDFLRDPYMFMSDKIRENFAPSATVKLWGCNTGVANWVYKDNGSADPSNTSAPYYWRALNEKNTPKPKFAQALAWYLKRLVHGASSGSHIEVVHRGAWISSDAYRAAVGEWPAGSLVHRLQPDRGNYDAYKP